MSKNKKLNKIMLILSKEYENEVGYIGFTYFCNMVDICNGSTLYSLSELYMLLEKRLGVSHVTIEKGIRRFKDMVVGEKVKTKEFLNNNIILVNNMYDKITI